MTIRPARPTLCLLQWALCNGAVALLLCRSALQAQEPQQALFDLHTADGVTVSGPLEQVREDWSVSLGGPSAKPASANEAITLRRTKMPLPGHPQEECVHFANGDCLAGTALRISDERAQFRGRFLGRGSRSPGPELSLPLASLSVLWFAAPDTVPNAALWRRRLLSERQHKDSIWLRNGDVVEGTLTALDEKAIGMEVAIDGRPPSETKLGRDRVAVVAFNTQLSRISEPKGTYARLVLANGGRLSLASAQMERGSILRCKTLFGATVQIPADQIAALDWRQGRAVYLSDLKALRYEHTPFFGVSWPYVGDSSVAGYDLRVAASSYDKGIGMHSESRLTYELDAGYAWFEALVGLDDRSGKGGSVLVEVLVDSKLADIGSQAELTHASGPRAIRLPVKGAKELTLVVKFGRHGDVQDHVNWADARLIK